MGDTLFKKFVDGNLLVCLDGSEAYVALSEGHEGICEAHQVGEKLKWVLRRQRVDWPMMAKDCVKHAWSYEEYQKHGNLQHVPTTKLYTIVKLWPFRGWALDLIRQINPPSSKGHKFMMWLSTILPNRSKLFH